MTAGDDAAAGSRTVVHGRHLRAALLLALDRARRPMTIPELHTALQREGYDTPGRASKRISDALRWEVRHGRVEHVGRGAYSSVGRITRQYRHRARARLRTAADRPDIRRRGDA